MAVYPKIIASRSIRSTTIVSAQVQNNAGQQLVPPKLTSNSLSTGVYSRITAADATDVKRLVKVLNDIQDGQTQSTAAARANPFSAPSIIRGVSFQPNQTKVIKHTLGRNYSDWHATSAVGAPAQFVAIPLPNPTYPGITADKYIVLQSLAGGTYTIVVVGD